MKRLLSEQGACIDLCYIDPPFNSARNYPMAGDKRKGAGFQDTWTQVDYEAPLAEIKDLRLANLCHYLEFIQTHYSAAYMAYLSMMGIRLYYIWRLLKQTGSFYLHCDATMSPYLRTMCDLIFGVAQYRNEIIWYYTNKIPNTRKRVFTRANDTLLFYVKDIQSPYTYHVQEEKRGAPAKFTKIERKDGKKVTVRGEDGKVITFMRHVRVVDSVWQIPMLVNQKEYLRYPTQKPLALLERIIQASSNEGDVVADFFCGSGTALSAAQTLKRRWIGVDINPESVRIAKTRLRQKDPKASIDHVKT